MSDLGLEIPWYNSILISDTEPEIRNSMMEKLFGSEQFEVEHALSMYATSFFVLPAGAIYDDILSKFKEKTSSCHIYLIGFVPKVQLIKAETDNQILKLDYFVLEKKHELKYEISPDLKLIENDDSIYLQDSSGNRSWPSIDIFQRLNINFEVKYVGQSYGKDGSRNAIDRLMKHETLQKISLKGVPEGYQLTLLLLEIKSNNQVFTVFNPHAKEKDKDGVRIKAGLDKLFNTTEKERLSLYEASLIRYFCPQYNTEFKGSFPSTNLKILQDCYDKDFASVVAEICFDELPFKLFSDSVGPKMYHIVTHNLHKEIARKAFFSV